MIFVWEKVIVTSQFQIFDWKSHAFRFLIEFQTLLSNFDWDGHTYDFSKKRIRSENQMKNGMKKSHCVTAPLSRTLLFHILKLKLINSNTLVPKKKIHRSTTMKHLWKFLLWNTLTVHTHVPSTGILTGWRTLLNGKKSILNTLQTTYTKTVNSNWMISLCKFSQKVLNESPLTHGHEASHKIPFLASIN